MLAANPPALGDAIPGGPQAPTAPAVVRPANPHQQPQQQPSRPTNPAQRRSISNIGALVPGQIPPQAIPPTNGAIPTPVPPKGPQAGAGLPPFDAPRSPPGKNVNHVPCKFFRQGACQAGKACPFSHNLDPSTESAPCKYFSKGNCKFGQKCALAHILPDGRRVNRPHHGANHLSFHRMDNQFTNHRSALHNSLMQANANNGPQHTPSHSLTGQEFPPLPGNQMDPSIQVPTPDPQMASPRNAELGQLSSSTRTLGPLDATLPASIDRYDYSYFAKHGPFASSVPNAFGLESPSSLSSSFRGEALSALRKSAFGEEDNLTGEQLSRSPFREGMGSFSERTLHSAARRPKAYASSYGGATHMMGHFGGQRSDPFGKGIDDDDLDQNFAFEEDLVPGSLSELLTPAERSRRMSRTDDDRDISSSFRNSFASPTNGDVFGSPPVGSPGSWGPIVSRHKREEEPISGIGHVGSPLRNSFPYADRESLGARAINRGVAGSAPGGGISALTLGFKTTSLHDSDIGPKSLERTISSPRLGNGKMIQPIEEEEPEETQFDIEVEEEAGPTKHVGGFTMGSGAGSDFFTGRS